MENVVKRKINESISVDRLRAISSCKVILYEDLGRSDGKYEWI